jgi:hypothetical protein
MLKPHERKEKMVKAFNLLKDEYGVSMIVNYAVTSNFVDVVCQKGNDTITYRVYDNGVVTER